MSVDFFSINFPLKPPSSVSEKSFGRVTVVLVAISPLALFSKAISTIFSMEQYVSSGETFTCRVCFLGRVHL